MRTRAAAAPAALPVDTASLDAVRRFNRFYTRWLGLLDEHLLASRFTLTEVRVLYELAHRDGLAASALARELALDAGYLSRILKRFGAQGLLRQAATPGDARSREIWLSAKGRAVFAPLEQASREQLASLLAGIDGPGLAQLVSAMRRIEDLLAPHAAAPSTVVLRPHRIGDIGWITRRQGQLYAQEYGWDGSFEALVAEIGARFLRDFDPASERCWIAERDGEIVGSVFVVKQSPRVAKLRLLYVEPSARGLGLGRRLVDECIAFAREKGYRKLTLWTNAVLVAARRIYESRGFRLVKQERHRSFGMQLVGQHWDLLLDQADKASAPKVAIGTPRVATSR